MVWSSSSSVCPCDDYWLENFPNFPTGMQFYSPTVTQPLVYYAQLQPRKQKQKTDRQKRKANYFVKAFRWYTQEHKKNAHNVSEDGTLGGFATWLDNKYEEYLQNQQIASNEVFQRKSKAQSSHKGGLNKQGTGALSESWGVKKSAITKRQQWIKFRSSRKKLQPASGSNYPRPSHSLEFILQPKELKMSNSKCCNVNCSNKTSVTDVKKYILKKHRSMSNILVENTNNTGEKKKHKHFSESGEIRDFKEYVNQIPDAYKQRGTLDVECQCVNEDNVPLSRRRPEMKISKETQFSYTVKSGQTEDKIVSITRISELFENTRSVVVNATERESKTSHKDCQCVNINYLLLDGQPQRPRENITLPCNRVCRQPCSLQLATPPCQAVVKDELDIKSNTRQGNRVIVSKCATITQTSDYSVHINTGPPVYPLFMKILCPDKL